MLAVTAETPRAELIAAVRAWIVEHVPQAWRDAAPGGPRAIRAVRPRADYEAWYPVFGGSGLVAPTWPVEYGGLDLPPALARLVEAELRPYNLGRLNPLGLHNAAPALFAHGTEEQRLRFLPPIVRAEEILVPALQRARRRVGPRVAGDACRPRRRRVDRHRPEGLDDVGVRRRLRGAAGAYRSGCAET